MNGTITEVFRQVQSGVEVKIRGNNEDSTFDLIMQTGRSNLITNRVILIGIRGMSQIIQIADMYLCMLFAENIITMSVRNNFIEGAKHAMTWYLDPRPASE